MVLFVLFSTKVKINLELILQILDVFFRPTQFKIVFVAASNINL
jgi:hypothetical protein